MAKNKIKSALSSIGVVYARYSSHNQKDASIEQQVAACRQKAKELGITVTDSYEDRAISGKTDKRPSFQRMMKDAEKGLFFYVIAWKSNRMGRNMLEAMLNEAKLQNLGIRVLYVEEDFDDTAAGRFALRSMMNVNQFYSENMAEDIMRGLMDNAQKCMVNGNPGYGHKKGEDGRYAIDEVEAPIVVEIYERIALQEPFVDIFNDLNARGIKSPSGKQWNRSSFHRLLPPNERCIGVYKYSDVRIEGGVPRIVSDELYYKVWEVLKMKSKPQNGIRTTGEYLLTGKLFCGKCKAPMTGISGTGKGGKLHFYYTCHNRRRNHSCDMFNVRRDKIELAVSNAIKEYALQPEIIEWIADKTVEYNNRNEEEFHIAALQDQLRDVKKSINNIMTAIEQGIITDTTKERLLRLESEQKELNAKISMAKNDIISVSREEVIAGLSMYRDGDVDDKKFQAELFDTFLVAVYVYKDHLKIIFSFTGDKNSVDVPIEEIEKEALSGDMEDMFVSSPRCSTSEKMTPLRASFLFRESATSINNRVQVFRQFLFYPAEYNCQS